MGRFGSSNTPTGVAKPLFRVHYRKLVEDQPQPTPPPINHDAANSLQRPAIPPECMAYYCQRCGYKQNLKTEELNSIVENAFRMAYAAHLQRHPNFRDVIASQLEEKHLQRMNLYSGDAPLSPLTVDPLTSGGSPTLLAHSKPFPEPSLRAYSHSSHNNNRTGLEPNQCLLYSEENNSPTALNTDKSMEDKPPLMKRIAMSLNPKTMPDDEDSPLVQRNPVNGRDSRSSTHPLIDLDVIKQLNLDNSLNLSPSVPSESDLKLKRVSLISRSSSSSVSIVGNKVPVPPPPPERFDSLSCKVHEELKAAPWFQAGIPREITLEVLGQEPIGSFIVRESTTKPGCFALSLRVPKDFQNSGIAHYLIMRTNKGYKIKGFTKEFSSLTALITHHSVMPELLPCPLSLSRHNPSPAKDEDGNKDFADIDTEPDENTLANFRKMMADLNV